jgi:hypothetical protein
MPINSINTPNLVTDVASIASITATQQGAATTVFSDVINLCFQLKPTQDCDAMILHDFTDYQELGTVDLNDLTITFSYGIQTDCGVEEICAGLPFTPNSQYTINDLSKDGCYVVSVHIEYSGTGGTTDDPIVFDYTHDFDVHYEKDCCSASFKVVDDNIIAEMRTILGSICTLSKVGRKIKHLKDNYVKLSNLNWLYNNSKDPCSERDKVLCMFNKIKC